MIHGRHRPASLAVLVWFLATPTLAGEGERGHPVEERVLRAKAKGSAQGWTPRNPLTEPGDPSVRDFSLSLDPLPRGSRSFFKPDRWFGLKRNLGLDVDLSSVLPRPAPIGAPNSSPAEFVAPGQGRGESRLGGDERSFEIRQVGSLKSFYLAGRYRRLEPFEVAGNEPRSVCELSLRVGYALTRRVTWLTEVSLFDVDPRESLSESLRPDGPGRSAWVMGILVKF